MNRQFVCNKCRQLKEKPETPDVVTQENLWIVAFGLCKECYDTKKNEADSK